MRQPEINPTMEERMWLEIDETISSNDRESLYAYLESHPDARGHFEELRRMALLFGRAGEIDPPPELHGRILRALENATPPVAQSAGVRGRLGVFFAPRPVWRFAVVAAAGVFIGVIGYHLFQQGLGTTGPLDRSQFYGAMTFDSAGLDGTGLHIDVPGVTGSLAVRRDESRVYSELDVTSQHDVEITLVYGGSPLTLAVGKLPDHPTNRVAIQDGEVHVRHRGSGVYRFLFELDDDPASPVRVSILSEGNVLFEGEVSPAREGGKR